MKMKAIFDLLTKPEPKLTKAQELAVKKVARELQELLAVAQWQTKPQPRAAVQSTIRFTLNDLPKEPYPQNVWDQKVEAVWAYVFSRGQTRREARNEAH